MPYEQKLSFLIINDKKVKEESVKENKIKFNDKGLEAEAVLNRHFSAGRKKLQILQIPINHTVMIKSHQ